MTTKPDEPILITVAVTRTDLMRLGRLTDCRDAQETLARVVRLTVEMCEDCDG